MLRSDLGSYLARLEDGFDWFVGLGTASGGFELIELAYRRESSALYYVPFHVRCEGEWLTSAVLLYD